MKLWKIERTDDVDYEQNSAHIVEAETEAAVRAMADSMAATGEPGSIWYAPTTTVEHIGEGLGLVRIVLTQNRGA